MRLRISILLVCTLIGWIENTEKNSLWKESYYLEHIFQNGIRQIKIKYNGIEATETAVGPMHGSSRGIVVRQVSNGKQVVAEVLTGTAPYVSESRDQNLTSNWQLLTTDPFNMTLGSQGVASLLPETPNLTPHECQVHKLGKKSSSFFLNLDFDASLKATLAGLPIQSELIYKDYKDLTNLKSKKELPTYLREILRFHRIKKQCKRMKHLLSKPTTISNPEAVRSKESSNKRRVSRSLKELFILPGTKWCGRGRLAKEHDDLDGHMVADHCCRMHDLCPVNIAGFTRRFGFNNYGPTTISHCSCDKKFRICLKQSGSGASELVGNVFFNVLSSKCFDLQRKKTCLKRGTWKCLKWGYEKQAFIRKPQPWNTEQF